MELKRKHIHVTKLLQEEKTEVLILSRETAVQVIQDLVNDLAGTGTSKLVLRDDDNRFFILSLKV